MALPVWLDRRHGWLVAGALLATATWERSIDPEPEEFWAVEHRLVLIAATSGLPAESTEGAHGRDCAHGRLREK